MSSYTFSVGIDFGTGYSGAAVFLFQSNLTDPIRPIDMPDRPQYQKTRTALLTDNSKFRAWGDDAFDVYSGLEEASSSELLILFKLSLQNLDWRSNGRAFHRTPSKHWDATSLVAEYLKRLKNHVLTELRRVNPFPIDARRDIRWVLTIPAIWDSLSKDLMIEAAITAGLVDSIDDVMNKRIELLREPEAAACRLFQIMQRENQSLPRDGSTMMFLDIGHGTVDITTYEFHSSGASSSLKQNSSMVPSSLKQIGTYSGGRCGGHLVNAALLTAVKKRLCSKETWDQIEKDQTPEVRRARQELLVHIEDTKQRFTIERETAVEIQVSRALYKKYEMEPSAEIPAVEFRRSFQPMLDGILDAFDSALQCLPGGENVDLLYPVGGAAKSSVVVDFIRNHLRHGFRECREIADPQIAVVCGAALYGVHPQIIRGRMVSHAYGTSCSKKFEDGVDNPKKRFPNYRGEAWCKDRFLGFVSPGQIVDPRTPLKQTLTPLSPDDKSAVISLHKSSRADIRYTDESGVYDLGEVTVEWPGHGVDRKMDLYMYFADTIAYMDCIPDGNEALRKRIPFEPTYRA